MFFMGIKRNIIFLLRFNYDYKNNSLSKACLLKIFYLLQIIIFYLRKSPRIMQFKNLTKPFILQTSESGSAEENSFLRILLKGFISDPTDKTSTGQLKVRDNLFSRYPFRLRIDIIFFSFIRYTFFFVSSDTYFYVNKWK